MVQKEFVITFGGKERRIRFTTNDARVLRKRFDKPLSSLIAENLMGWRNGTKHDYDLEAIAAVAMLGLQHFDRTVTEDKFFTGGENGGWLDDTIDEGSLEEKIVILARAVYASGVVNGHPVDIDNVVKRFMGDATPSGDEGKAAPPAAIQAQS